MKTTKQTTPTSQQQTEAKAEVIRLGPELKRQDRGLKRVTLSHKTHGYN